MALGFHGARDQRLAEPEAAPAEDQGGLSAPQLEPRYRFETFVVGNSNQLAYAASKSIAENPSGSFNPLFIYGGAGLGKTHLIQAIGQQIKAQRPQMKVVYMSGYTEEVLPIGVVNGSHGAFIHKPFTLNILANTIRSTLDR